MPGLLSDHWFEPVADHLGEAYLRYSFTKGTEQEVDFLVDELGLEPGQRVLDVGCGPGRHAHALGRRGIAVHGVDISERFVELARVDAPPGVTFERADARSLAFAAEFDAVISLCQGAFGLQGGGDVDPSPPLLDPDLPVLEGIARALRPGGRCAVSAFSAYFQVRWLEEQDRFDVDRGVNLEQTEVRSPDGSVAEVELWTSCFTPRELRLLAAAAGLTVRAVHGAVPGGYAPTPPGLEHPEFLLVAER